MDEGLVAGQVERYLLYGIYGITPIGDSLSVYGGLIAITSDSHGQELFTDKTRSYTNLEDAYVGLVGGIVDGNGNRLSYNLTAGRQRFTLANGFLIANTAANGEDRAALQANARWSSDLLVLGQIAYYDTKFEAFCVDPDELPILYSDTKIAGLNFETKPIAGLTLGATYLTVPKSNTNYFSPTGTIAGGRENLELWDVRFTYQPNPTGAAGPFFGGEIARQTNRKFDMDARAGWVEAGYHMPQANSSPSISDRVSYFSGDDPVTSTYERWNPQDAVIPGRQNVVPIADDYFIPGRFEGKTVIVKGSARGMGEVAARRLAREGANVVGVDILEDLGAAVIEAIKAEGGNATFVGGDISEDATCAQMVRVAVDTYGGLDGALGGQSVFVHGDIAEAATMEAAV